MNKPWVALLKQVRQNRGLTQEQFAKQFGVATNTVSRWENGAYDVPAEVLWWLLQQKHAMPTVCSNCNGTGVIYPPSIERQP